MLLSSTGGTAASLTGVRVAVAWLREGVQAGLALLWRMRCRASRHQLPITSMNIHCLLPAACCLLHDKGHPQGLPGVAAGSRMCAADCCWFQVRGC